MWWVNGALYVLAMLLNLAMAIGAGLVIALALGQHRAWLHRRRERRVLVARFREACRTGQPTVIGPDEAGGGIGYRNVEHTVAVYVSEQREAVAWLRDQLNPGIEYATGPDGTRYARTGDRITRLCGHDGAVPVDLLLTGERVAWLCEACGEQLPADWGAADLPGVTRRILGGPL
jgi:hypothetical protein